MESPESEAADLADCDGPPAWARAGIEGDWHRLSGGRINDVWQSDQRVVKLYRTDGASTLFPNDPFAEARALRHLAALQITPRLVGLRSFGSQSALIIEAAGAGRPEAAAMGEVLARVHGLPPVGQERVAKTGVAEIRAEVAAFLREAGELRELLPAEPPEVTHRAGWALLHGDPVAANFVSDRRGAKMIDWSAAALGDPAHDIALAVSPAMTLLYGGGDHATHASGVLSGYGRSETYFPQARWLHWRIAAYCLWRAAQGAPGYHAAALAEIAFLGDLASN